MILGLSAGAASADTFVNGGFETGSTAGWTQSGGQRGGLLNNNLSAATLAGGVAGASPDAGRSQIMSLGDVDPHLGSLLGATVQSGSHSVRIEDTVNGGYATVLSQTVSNYTDSNIFFAWKSVLEGAHGVQDAATMIISLTDVTTGIEAIHREYNAASGGAGVDPRFSYDSFTNDFYTPDWQIEDLVITSGLAGHTFNLSVLASDCEPTGHYGYVYLDGFGAVAPPPGPVGGIPEPATWAMMLVGFGGLGAVLRNGRRRAAAAA